MGGGGVCRSLEGKNGQVKQSNQKRHPVGRASISPSRERAASCSWETAVPNIAGPWAQANSSGHDLGGLFSSPQNWRG